MTVHVLGTDCQIYLDIKYNSKVEVKSKALLENCIYLFIFGLRRWKKVSKTAFGERYNKDFIDIVGLVKQLERVE